MVINIDKVTKRVVLTATPFTLQVEVSDTIKLEKRIELQDGHKQKTDANGKLLYKINIKSDIDFEETIESKTATKYEDKEIINKWIDDSGEPHEEKVISEIPVDWVDNAPIIVPNMIQKHISFSENQELFNLDDVMAAKYKDILENSNCDYIIAQEFIEQNIDINDKDHLANTGIGFVQLLPNGQAKTKEIELDAAVTQFELLSYEGSGAAEIYINDVKFQNKKAVLPDKVNKIVITFKNPTDRACTLNAYSIGY